MDFSQLVGSQEKAMWRCKAAVGTQALGHRVKYIAGEVIERCGLVKSSTGLCSWCHLQALKLQ